jgi:hypothetical protein
LKLKQDQIEVVFYNCSKGRWRWYFGTAERADGDGIFKTAARANGDGIF